MSENAKIGSDEWRELPFAERFRSIFPLMDMSFMREVHMTSDIKNALTADEWVAALQRRDFEYFADTEGVSAHGKAALCLYQQPFGFTREDVANLHEDIADEWSDTEHRRWLQSLAARISALLPPDA